MKAEKMYLKINKILDDNADIIMGYSNTENGAYFSLDGYVGYFLPGHEILSGGENSPYQRRRNYAVKHNGTTIETPHFVMEFDTTGENTHPATEITRGKIAKPKRNILRLQNKFCTVYIQEKFVKEFPANTVYYISGPTSPVVAGIWQDDKLYTFAVIMPYLLKTLEVVWEGNPIK